MTTIAPESVDLTELVGDVEIKCTYVPCTSPARWVVHHRAPACEDVRRDLALLCDEHHHLVVTMRAFHVPMVCPFGHGPLGCAHDVLAGFSPLNPTT